MKKTVLAVGMMITFSAMAQIKMPQPSTTQTIVQDFGLGKIEITYSRPNIKNRKVFTESSELAPFGKIWRTGANSATKLRLTEPATVAGNKLDTGVYAIYTIPEKGEWTLIINKGSKNWGSSQYDEANDIFRAKVPATKAKQFTETFAIQFANVKAESCDLQLIWGKAIVSIPFTTDIKPKIKAQVEKTLAEDNVSNNAYYTAANFYYEMEKDYTKALQCVTKAIDGKTDKYWQWLLKAKIEKELGDKVSAKASAETCIKSATEQKNDDYVRSSTEFISKL
jgi:tetratricopeptide (TPR) repeat protein